MKKIKIRKDQKYFFPSPIKKRKKNFTRTDLSRTLKNKMALMFVITKEQDLVQVSEKLQATSNLLRMLPDKKKPVNLKYLDSGSLVQAEHWVNHRDADRVKRLSWGAILDVANASTYLDIDELFEVVSDEIGARLKSATADELCEMLTYG